MRSLIVFESMFGNSELVALAIADGIASRGQLETDVVEVSAAPGLLTADIELLVVGGPTHAFSMTRPATRQDAAKAAPDGLVSRGRGIREWLDDLQVNPDVMAATFDTRIGRGRVPGSAARSARRRLARKGFNVTLGTRSFFVAGTAGPLGEGEQARAHQWGEHLAASLLAGRADCHV
jgi:hypothetical protein